MPLWAVFLGTGDVEAGGQGLLVAPASDTPIPGLGVVLVCKWSRYGRLCDFETPRSVALAWHRPVPVELHRLPAGRLALLSPEERKGSLVAGSSCYPCLEVTGSSGNSSGLVPEVSDSRCVCPCRVQHQPGQAFWTFKPGGAWTAPQPALRGPRGSVAASLCVLGPQVALVEGSDMLSEGVLSECGQGQRGFN